MNRNQGPLVKFGACVVLANVQWRHRSGCNVNDVIILARAAAAAAEELIDVDPVLPTVFALHHAFLH
jgi:hypothetical protein